MCHIYYILFLCLQFCTSKLFFLLPEFRNNDNKTAECTFFLKVEFHKNISYQLLGMTNIRLEFLHALLQDHLLEQFFISTGLILFLPLLLSDGGKRLQSWLIFFGFSPNSCHTQMAVFFSVMCYRKMLSAM